MRCKLLVIVLLCYLSLTAIEVRNFNQDNGLLINDKVHDVFFYNTEDDDINGSWKSNSDLSWYNEPVNPGDDFTGSLDENRWQLLGDAAVDGYIFFSGRCSYFIDGTPTNGALFSENRWNLTGDFDIQVSYSQFNADNGSGIRLEIKDDGYPGNYYLFAERFKKEDGSDVYTRNDYNGNYAETTNSDTEGRLRIVRTADSVATFYGYWDGTTDKWKWTQIGAKTYFGSYNVFVKIFTVGNNGSKDIETIVDNFIANVSETDCSFTLTGSNTRGTQRKFPDQAILIASERGLDIVNAADYSLWMRFSSYEDSLDAARHQNIVADRIHTTFALNGKIFCGAYEGYMTGIEVIDFTTDSTWFYDTHSDDGTGWHYFGNIDDRNKHRGWTDNGYNYVQIQTNQVYGISAKKIGNYTYLALANGKKTSDNMGRISIINIENNTISYDIISSTLPVIDVEISTNSDDYLYFLTEDAIYNSYSDWQTAGEFNADNGSSTSPVTHESSNELAINSNNIFVANQYDTTPYEGGDVTKRNLDNFTVNESYEKDYELSGSANSKGIAASDSCLFIATSHADYGKVYVIGQTSPHLDEVRGIFSYPKYLQTRTTAQLEFGKTDSKEYLLISYEDSVGITCLESDKKEISLQNPAEGKINFYFTDGDAFEYEFDEFAVSIDPANSKAAYGNVEVIMYAGAPSVDFPEHALDQWFEIEADSTFDAFPCQIDATFNSPVPDGDSYKQLFSSNDGGLTWITADDDSLVSVLGWNYTSAPYSVSFNTSHFSQWGMSDGDGENPLPIILSDFFANYNNNELVIFWTTMSETNNAGWNIYRNTSEDFTTALRVNGDEMISGQGSTNEITQYSYQENIDNLIMNQTYWYWLESVDYSGNTVIYSPISIELNQNPDNPEPPPIVDYGLAQNYPNPFNPETKISFRLKTESQVKLAIYNLSGQLIKILYQGNTDSGDFIWDGKNNHNKKVSSGIYFYKLSSDNTNYVKKMVLLK